VVSALALAATGHASRLSIWTSDGGVRLAGVAGVSGVAADRQLDPGTLFPDLAPPFGSSTVPLPSSVPLPTWPTGPSPAATPRAVLPLPVRILPPPPGPTAPPAAPTAPPRQPPVALGPGSSTRAPLPAPTLPPVRIPVPAPVTAPPVPRPAPTAPPPQPVQLEGPAAVSLSALNGARGLMGLSRLQADAALTRAAVEHAAQIAAAGQMSHSGYVEDVTQQGATWQGLGEVLGAYAQTPDPSVINQLWLASPEHRPIVLDPHYTAVGVGWAQGTNGWWYVSAILSY
jgi:uncharacterized protein YkwD